MNCAIAVCEMLLVRPLLRARAMRMVIGQQNMPRTFKILIWLALVVPSAAHAQGIWLQKGVSGVGAQVSISHQDGASGLELLGGYSYHGFLDFELSLGWADTPLMNIPDLTGVSVGANVVYHPLKQTREIPLSLKLEAGISQTTFSSNTLRDNDESLSGWDSILAGGVYRFFPLKERIGVTPEIDLGWNHSSATATVFDVSQTFTDDTFVIGVTAAFAYLDSAGHIWGVAPVLTFGPGNTPTTFTISMAFVATLPGAR
jgi:hypothetical protein